MLAGLVLIAIPAGAVAAGVALVMAFPLWIGLLAYSLVGTVTLLLCAVWASSRSETDRTLSSFGPGKGEVGTAPTQG